jgi:hypothetical protein
MHVYRVQARLVKWKHELNDGDYHLVLTDDTLNYTNELANPPVPLRVIASSAKCPIQPAFRVGMDHSDRRRPSPRASLRLVK